MNVFKSIVAGMLLAGSTVVAVVGLASGPVATDPLPAWAPNAHNTFAMTDDPDPNIPTRSAWDLSKSTDSQPAAAFRRTATRKLPGSHRYPGHHGAH